MGFMESMKYMQYFEFKCIFLGRDSLYNGVSFKKARFAVTDGSGLLPQCHCIPYSFTDHIHSCQCLALRAQWITAASFTLCSSETVMEKCIEPLM